MTEHIRVLRVLEYTGPRAMIEEHLEQAKHDGVHRFGKAASRITLRVTTMGPWPEIIHGNPVRDPWIDPFDPNPLTSAEPFKPAGDLT